MTMSEIASAVAARTAASVQIGMGKALGNQQMIEEGMVRQQKADIEYARALEGDRYCAARNPSDRSDMAC